MEINANGMSRDTLATLRCSICDNYLTVPPVTIISMTGDRYKCGRCFFVKTEVNIRASMFEKIAATLYFPCIFPNCHTEMSWDRMKRHEDTCPHQPMNCICGQSMELREAHIHFIERHRHLMSSEVAYVENPRFSQFHTRLITKNHVPFLVYILCERKADIKVGVFALYDTAKKYEFKVKVWAHGNKATVSILSQKVVKYNARQHCSDCLLRKCGVVFHKYQNGENYPVADMTSARVNTSSVFQVLGCENFVLSIYVLEQNDPVHLQAAYERNDLLRRSWECHVCREYLVAPIYLCLRGHSLCGPCKSRITVCPYCDEAIGPARNLILEEMAGCVQLTCSYESKGCSFKGNVHKMAKHEMECEKGDANRPGVGPSMIRLHELLLC